MENILIFGATSDIAADLIKRLLHDGLNVYAVSRSKLELEGKKLYKFNADLSCKEEISALFKKLPDIKFDCVLCFQGLAISSPVEFLESAELKRALSVSLFSLLEILKNVKDKISFNSKIINISSMAAYGIYPYIAPYAVSKAASDILLAAYEIETGIKTVSIKPGVVGTKFWKFCVKENACNFENFSGLHKIRGEFLKANAVKNSTGGISPKKVSSLIYKVIKTKHPKASYNVGFDSYFSLFISFFKGRILYSIIRYIMDKRVEAFTNGKSK